ncbi:YrrS family protein [Bhargavaea ullalensis]|uniref:DUF1510 domain-containing protein n=1 Tax=Bhargavaea ullalensis TaxID=1265685 RepID=A0ABV2G8Y5_9BACL
MDQRNLSRVERNHRKSNRILNILIAIVFTLILVTAAGIFMTGGKDTAGGKGAAETGNDSGGTPETGLASDSQDDESDDGGEEAGQPDDESDTEEDDEQTKEPADEEDEASGEPGKVIRTPSEDGIVEETIVDTSWKPIGTSQTGEHRSVYDKGHIDWKEKVEAIEYATGIPESDMIVWYLKNGGGPDKSVGTVSTKDQKKKYNVHLEWVDGEGWKPVRLDKLNSLEGAW